MTIASTIRPLALPALVILLSGCVMTGTPMRSGSEGEIVTALEAIAARDANVDGVTGDVDCWNPSEHPIAKSPEQFRVLCRVYYTQQVDDQQDVNRYRDMICVGKFTAEPAVDSCYQWVPYSDTPAFEDEYENSSW